MRTSAAHPARRALTIDRVQLRHVHMPAHGRSRALLRSCQADRGGQQRVISAGDRTSTCTIAPSAAVRRTGPHRSGPRSLCREPEMVDPTLWATLPHRLVDDFGY